ncbi:MAG: inositol monophosphatase [bacterium]
MLLTLEQKQNLLEIMLNAAQKASKLQIEKFRQPFQISQKSSHTDLVTEVDIASQKIIIDSVTEGCLKAGFDEDKIGFIGEENVDSQKELTFIIDPLDGTSNYAIGFEYFSILIALYTENEIQIGLVYYPIGETYYRSIKDQGSFKVDKSGVEKKLLIKPKKLSESILVSNLDGFLMFKNNFIRSLRGKRMIYGVGLELALITEGIFDIQLNDHPHLWDIAGLTLIIKEAGGIFVDFKGVEVNLDMRNISKTYQTLVCHPDLLESVINGFDKV